MSRKRGLGRGLDALLAGRASAPAPDATVDASGADAGRDSASAAGTRPAETASADGELRSLPIDQLRPGRYQPRRVMDEEALEELAQSIRAQGVMQPIVVRRAGSEFEIIAGERRWRASRLAGLAAVPVVIREIDDQAAMAMGLIENIQRENLRPLEEAAALQRLLQEFDLTQQQVATAVGKSRAAVTNLLRLLNLSLPVRELLDAGDLEMGHARALLSLAAEAQLAIARQVVDQGLSVRETEARARAALKHQRDEAAGVRPAPKTAPAAPTVDADVRRLEQRLSELLGAPVNLRQASGGSGRLEIRYHSMDVLDGILARLGYREDL